jgi:hypothetical protein
MYDSGKIIAGILIFIILLTFPVWYNIVLGDPSGTPVLVKPSGDGQTECVKSASYMRTLHMDLLNEWRDDVVRDGRRFFTTASGKKFEMSLSKTCIQCHSNKDQFCDQCHNYLAVTPYCWDCHVEPEKMEKY